MISLMKCRLCGGTLSPKDETLTCNDCGHAFENYDDAIGDPLDDEDDLPSREHCVCCGIEIPRVWATVVKEKIYCGVGCAAESRAYEA